MFFETKFLTDLLLAVQAETGCPRRPKDLNVSTSLRLGLQVCVTMPSFLTWILWVELQSSDLVAQSPS